MISLWFPYSFNVTKIFSLIFSVKLIVRHGKFINVDMVSLMFLAGDVEVNPGPIRRGRKPKWPCRICCYAVKDDDKALSCDRCEFLMHNDCSGVSDESYAYYQDQKQFDWKCPECEVMHFEDSFFLD